MKLLLVLLTAAVAACASVNDSLTPSLVLLQDEFDGSSIVRQPPVSAATFGDAFHALGFEWSAKTPDIVYVTAGIARQQSIQGVAFNADGKLIENLKLASATTTFDGRGGLQSSYRRFAMSWADFLTVATAGVVKMRLDGVNDYTVSSFGPNGGSQAVVNKKLPPFVAKVQQLRGAKP